MKKIYSFLFTVLFFTCAIGQPVLTFTKIDSTNLTAPVDVVHANDGSNRLFIVQQNGIIKIYSNGVVSPVPFLNISTGIVYSPGGERGLLSIAFHPDYANNRYFFLYYNNTAGNVTIAQYRTKPDSPNVADPASGKVLFSIPKANTNHNGGKLNFGADGNLYFGTGDGGGSGDVPNNAQNGLSLLGKMIRINVENFTTPPYHTVPASNPFIGNPAVSDSVFALGLRNPWRWTFDKLTGDMWIADVGQNLWEEVNFITPANMSGANYGWRCYEGNHVYNTSACGATPLTGKTFPIFEYGHNAAGGYSISGGVIYRGSVYPALQGYYIFCDYVTKNGWTIKDNGAGGWTTAQQTNFPAHIVSFGVSETDSLYALSLDGVLYKVGVVGVLPVNLISFSAQNNAGRDILKWSSTVDASLVKFEIEISTNGTRFSHLADVSPESSGNTAAYVYNNSTGLNKERYYRIKLHHNNGTIVFSDIVKVENNIKRIIVQNKGNGLIQLTTPRYVEQINVISSEGKILARYNNIFSGNQLIDLSKFPKGFYLLQCNGSVVENIPVVNF